MQKGKTVSAYIAPDDIFRLDQIRGDIPRSQALSKILSYMLSQPEAWLTEFLRRDSV